MLCRRIDLVHTAESPFEASFGASVVGMLFVRQPIGNEPIRAVGGATSFRRRAVDHDEEIGFVSSFCCIRRRAFNLGNSIIRVPTGVSTFLSKGMINLFTDSSIKAKLTMPWQAKLRNTTTDVT